MALRTTVRDCLYVNWAVPSPALPPLPEPLRHELHPADDREWGFASALLFFHDRLRMRGVPFVRLSYPQVNLRLNVLDGEGVPSVYFRRMLVPLWVVAPARIVGGVPARSAHLELARPSRDPEVGEWVWRVGRGGHGEAMVVRARRAAPPAGAGPEVGSWEDTVRFFRERHRGYHRGGGELQRIDTEQPRSSVWPLRVEVEGAEMVARSLGLGRLEGSDGADGDGQPVLQLHSAWLSPEMPLLFESVRVRPPEEPVRSRVPAAG
jgi:hypothetical protein